MLGVSVMLPLMLVEELPAVVDGEAPLAADVGGAGAAGGPTVTRSRRDEQATTRMVAPTAATIRRCTRSPYGPRPPLPMAARPAPGRSGRGTGQCVLQVDDLAALRGRHAGGEAAHVGATGVL